LNIISFTLRSSNGLFPSGSPIESFQVCPMRATYPDHFIILELITLTGKDYELYTLSFYGFLPPL